MHRSPRRTRAGTPAAILSFTAALLLGAGAGQAKPPSGAIFTTTPDGAIVNENVHYDFKREVYLDGGPPPNAPREAAGLDDGWYVYQVTDPSGRILLSQDPSKCRIVDVVDGVISRRVLPSELGLGLADTWTRGNGQNQQTFPCHIDDDPPHPTDAGVAGASERHDTNVDMDHGGMVPDEDAAIVVQLMPYGTTPNPGGVYKAWIILLASYWENGGELEVVPRQLSNGQQRPHRCPDFCAREDDGFASPRADSKTDNFKVDEGGDVVLAPSTLCVKKFHDLDADGLFEPAAGEPEIGVALEDPAFCLPFDPDNLQCVEVDGTLDPDCDTGGGWPVSIADPMMMENPAYTFVEILTLPLGDYEIMEETFASESPGLWEQSAAFLCDGVVAGATCGQISDATDLGVTNPVLFEADGVPVAGEFIELSTVVFGNFQPVSLHGRKVIDRNADGSLFGDVCPDPGVDPGNAAGCVDVPIHLTGADGAGNPVERTTHTCGGSAQSDCMSQPRGSYWFTDLAPGSYTVTLEEPSGFLCSYPTPPDQVCSYPAISLSSGDSALDLDFGDFKPVDVHAHKFFDENANGIQDGDEPDVEDVEFCLASGGIPVTEDAFGNPIEACMRTNGAGMVWWLDLAPGTYAVTETPPAGTFPTTPVGAPSLTQTVALESCDSETLEFGNGGPCDGLTPGYWKNWRNHYTDAQFLTLLPGTIAGDIAAVDTIFEDYNAGSCAGCDPITILKAMLLANQLTLALTQSDLPNPSGGSLFPLCSAPGVPKTLGEVIADALDILANPAAATREWILQVKTWLDIFANLDAS